MTMSPATIARQRRAGLAGRTSALFWVRSPCLSSITSESQVKIVGQECFKLYQCNVHPSLVLVWFWPTLYTQDNTGPGIIFRRRFSLKTKGGTRNENGGCRQIVLRSFFPLDASLGVCTLRCREHQLGKPSEAVCYR